MGVGWGSGGSGRGMGVSGEWGSLSEINGWGRGDGSERGAATEERKQKLMTG